MSTTCSLWKVHVGDNGAQTLNKEHMKCTEGIRSPAKRAANGGACPSKDCQYLHVPLYWGGGGKQTPIDAEYDRAKVPPYNGNDPPPAPGSLKALLFPPRLNKVQNKGTEGVRARYGAELPPFVSIVRCLGRPVILGVEPNMQN